MQYRSNGYRFKNYYNWCDLKNNPYDYERNGLLQHIMSHKIIESNNNILMIIKEYFEKSLIFLMKYVDRLKNFKNYCWKNR